MAAVLQLALLIAGLIANAQHSDPSRNVQAAIATPTLAAPLPHVRSSDSLAAALLATGSRTSPTFAHLVMTLDRVPDLVVYVSTTTHLDHRGSIVFVSRAGAITYLLIRISAQQRDCDRVAVLAHEMTHAVEIAQADPPVTSDSDLERLFACIGTDSTGGRLESTAAVRAEQAVRHEIGG
jgi:hypothetical protein